MAGRGSRRRTIMGASRMYNALGKTSWLLGMILCGNLSSCQSGGAWADGPPSVAYLPYIEAAELPAEIRQGEPFSISLKVSTQSRASLMKSGRLVIDYSPHLMVSSMTLRPYISASYGVPIGSDGWCSFTVDSWSVFDVDPAQAPIPITFKVL